LVREGFMPVTGGALDQSHVFLVADELITRLWSHHQGKWERRQSLAKGRDR
jgi:hypothetical protein